MVRSRFVTGGSAWKIRSEPKYVATKQTQIRDTNYYSGGTYGLNVEYDFGIKAKPRERAETRPLVTRSEAMQYREVFEVIDPESARSRRERLDGVSQAILYRVAAHRFEACSVHRYGH